MASTQGERRGLGYLARGEHISCTCTHDISRSQTTYLPHATVQCSGREYWIQEYCSVMYHGGLCLLLLDRRPSRHRGRVVDIAVHTDGALVGLGCPWRLGASAAGSRWQSRHFHGAYVVVSGRLLTIYLLKCVAAGVAQGVSLCWQTNPTSG